MAILHAVHPSNLTWPQSACPILDHTSCHIRLAQMSSGDTSVPQLWSWTPETPQISYTSLKKDSSRRAGICRFTIEEDPWGAKVPFRERCVERISYQVQISECRWQISQHAEDTPRLRHSWVLLIRPRLPKWLNMSGKPPNKALLFTSLTARPHSMCNTYTYTHTPSQGHWGQHAPQSWTLCPAAIWHPL